MSWLSDDLLKTLRQPFSLRHLNVHPLIISYIGLSAVFHCCDNHIVHEKIPDQFRKIFNQISRYFTDYCSFLKMKSCSVSY